MLLLERDDDHARWQAERESWDSYADALLYKTRTAQEPLLREQVWTVTMHFLGSAV